MSEFKFLANGTQIAQTLSIPAPYFEINIFYCPECHKPTLSIYGKNDYLSNFNVQVYPTSLAKQYPDYVPIQIRQDYIEAFNILHLSPKASATLARRCIQGMIHDFFGVKEKNLNAEITAIKDKVEPVIWQGLDDLRQLGNIGAHMEKDINRIIDIDSGEAEKLVKLIEFLIESWYIKRHETEQLFADINSICHDKQEQRNN